MRLYTYTVDHDLGVAPNPFHGYCTLARCKPVIRRMAKDGDWIVGITGKRKWQGPRSVVYAMRLDETLSFAEYWEQERFKKKRPNYTEGAPLVERRGDNRYKYRSDGSVLELRPDEKHHELSAAERIAKSAERVLVSRRFTYYGVKAPELPQHLQAFALPSRFYRVNFDPKEKAALLKFVENLPRGILGRPNLWTEDDDSWQPRGSRCG